MVTATPQIAALLLALLQLGTPASDRVEKSNADERLEPSRQAREEIDSLRTEWLEEIRASDSVEDALLEIVGSYEMAEFLVLTHEEIARTSADPMAPGSQTGTDFAIGLVSRVPRAHRNNVAGLLGSLTEIEDSLVRLRSSVAGQVANSAAFRQAQDQKFSDPETTYEVLNEACFGVRHPAHVQRRLRSVLMFSVATGLAGEVGRNPDSFAPETLGDFFETWERLAAEVADSFELLDLLISGGSGEMSQDASSNLGDIMSGYARNGMLLDTLVQDAEAQMDPHAPPGMGPVGEETA